MNITTLQTALINAVAADATLASWANTNYSTTVTFYSDIDENDPPAEGNAPYIAIRRVRKTEGQEQDSKIHTFEMFCGLVNETWASRSVAVGAGVTSTVWDPTGASHIETMRGYARDALRGASMGNLTIDLIDTSYECVWPWFLTLSTINIAEQFTIGSNPFE